MIKNIKFRKDLAAIQKKYKSQLKTIAKQSPIEYQKLFKNTFFNGFVHFCFSFLEFTKSDVGIKKQHQMILECMEVYIKLFTDALRSQKNEHEIKPSKHLKNQRLVMASDQIWKITSILNNLDKYSNERVADLVLNFLGLLVMRTQMYKTKRIWFINTHKKIAHGTYSFNEPYLYYAQNTLNHLKTFFPLQFNEFWFFINTY